MIDTGVDINHPDLKPYIWRRKSAAPEAAAWLAPPYALSQATLLFAAGPEPARLIDFTMHGANFDAGSEDIPPQRNADYFPGEYPGAQPQSSVQLAHGTHCAGLVVATATGRFDVHGDIVRIMPIRVRNKWDIPDAVSFAVRNKAKIITLSIASPKAHGPTTEINLAIAEATAAGVLVVCAAGNRGEMGGADIDRKELFVTPACLGREYKDQAQRLGYPEPSLFRADRMITVGSVNRDDELSAFSCYGKVSVDLMAPGGLGERSEDVDLSVHNPDKEILSTIPTDIQVLDTGKWNNSRGPYAALYGTSQAAPQVAGAAALIWSHPKFQHLNAEDIKQLLVRNARR